MIKVIEDILQISLGVNSKERGVIFLDDFNGDGKLAERIEIVDKFLLVSGNLGFNLEKISIKNSGGNGLEPDKTLWRFIFGEDFIRLIEEKYSWKELTEKKISLEDLENFIKNSGKTDIPDFIIALSYFSTSHTSFRKILNKFGTRYVSMPLFDLKMFEGPLNINFDELEKDTLELWDKLKGKKGCVITNKSGTNLKFSFGNRVFKADTGNFREKGSFGNLPAGEVFIAPVEDMTEGSLVIEWTNEGKLKKPLLADIKNGRVVRLEGDEKLKDYLGEIFNRDGRNNCLCELGLGTNKRAKRADNILEAEKIYGTAHIAFGDNITFGGVNRASTHIDYVIFSPEIEWYG
ncbi:MAG: aminopeptidase [Proteobacteria bacterium]|nr:aminopeptidase [Pseudomonadota bacterium]